MTGTENARVRVPACDVAAAMLLRICSPLFVAAMNHQAQPRPGEGCFEAWYTLRRFADKFVQSRTCELTELERAMMFDAVTVAHDLAHDCEPGTPPHVTLCGCSMASMLEDLSIALALDEAQRQAVRA